MKRTELKRYTPLARGYVKTIGGGRALPRTRVDKKERIAIQTRLWGSEACALLEQAREQGWRPKEQPYAIKSNSEKGRQCAMSLLQFYKRKAAGSCISCGSQGELQGGHYISRRVLLTCIEWDNVQGQCIKCNYYDSGHHHNYRSNLVGLIGEERVKRLEHLASSNADERSPEKDHLMFTRGSVSGCDWIGDVLREVMCNANVI